MTNITTLFLNFNKNITDIGIANLIRKPNITTLNLRDNTTITDEALLNKTNITKLYVGECHKSITELSLTALTKLTELIPYYDFVITNPKRIPCVYKC